LNGVHEQQSSRNRLKTTLLTDFQMQRSATEHGLMFNGEESEDAADDEDLE
jgi:hypothetical protein